MDANEYGARDWNAEFVEITDQLFDAVFREGAATLLGSYDADRGLADAEGTNR